MTISYRFTYARFSSLDKAIACVEDMYATGDARPCEDPRVEAVKNKKTGKTVYHVTIIDTSL